MVTEIPTFRSERTTQIPSMGIVQQTGTRAMSQAMQSRAGVYDALGEFANRKADEFMARQMKKNAEKAVRTGGLNPAELRNPVTKAEQIYREAAISTYAIQVENDVSENLQRLYTENRLNPEGYRQKAQAYMQGAIQGLPAELKNGVSKYGLAQVRQHGFKLEQDYKARVLAESEALREAKLDKLSVGYTNATSPEERQVVMAQAMALIDSNSEILSPELKAAQFEAFTRKVTLEATVTDVMNGRANPLEAVQELKDAGIAVTPETQMRIYNSAGIHDQYERKMINAQKERNAIQAAGIEDALYEALLNPDLSEEEIKSMKAEAEERLTMLGVGGKDKFKILNSFERSFYDSIDISPEMDAYLDAVIEELNPDAEDIIRQAIREGAMPAHKGLEKMSRLRTARGSVENNSYFKQYEAEFLQPRFPLVFYYNTPNDIVDMNQRRQWEEQNTAYKNHIAQINELVNNPDPEKRLSIEDAIAMQKGKASQVLPENNLINSVPLQNPERIKIQQYLREEAPIISMYIPSRMRTERQLNVTLDELDISNLPPGDQRAMQYFKGKLDSKEKAVGQVRFFLRQNQLYFSDWGPEGRRPPYSEDFINGIIETFGITEEDLQQ